MCANFNLFKLAQCFLTKKKVANVRIFRILHSILFGKRHDLLSEESWISSKLNLYKKMTVYLRQFFIISLKKNGTSFEQSLVIFTQITFITRLADMGQMVSGTY